MLVMISHDIINSIMLFEHQNTNIVYDIL
jgi:hypothetical protein